MFLEELTTINFRNLANQTFKFKGGVTVFFGANAQGKTNILEAIYLLATGKSFRTRSDHELINWGQNQAKVFGKAGNTEPEIVVYPERKEFLVNKQSKKQTDLIGRFVVVIFTPTDIDIVAGSPDKRRRFLDSLGASIDKKYLYQLLSFNKIMRSRNQLLLQLRQGKQVDLTVWNLQLVKAASYLWLTRASLIANLNETLKVLGKKITKANLNLEYKNQFLNETRAKIEEIYLVQLEKHLGEDIQKTTTQLGPHRDDFKVVSEEEKLGKIVSKDLNIYGSRGEQRAASLALKLAEVSVIEKEINNQPTLLLDEVLGELDFEHRKLLLNHLRKLQTFITSTNLSQIQEILGSSFDALEIAEGKRK